VNLLGVPPCRPAPKHVRYIAKCKTCKVVTSGLSFGQDCNRSKSDAQRAGAVYLSSRGEHTLDCRVCGAPRHAIAVRGTYSAKKLCGARCMASTGPSCECSCGGKNHGASYG